MISLEKKNQAGPTFLEFMQNFRVWTSVIMGTERSKSTELHRSPDT